MKTAMLAYLLLIVVPIVAAGWLIGTIVTAAVSMTP